jgi:hypothetical protein
MWWSTVYCNFANNGLKITRINETWLRDAGTQSLTMVKISVNSCPKLLFFTRPGHVGAHWWPTFFFRFRLLLQQEISLRLSSWGSLCSDLERKCLSIIIIVINSSISSSVSINSEYDRWPSWDKLTVQRHILHTETWSLSSRYIPYAFSSSFINTVTSVYC